MKCNSMSCSVTEHGRVGGKTINGYETTINHMK